MIQKEKKERWMCGPSGIRTQVYRLIIKAGRSTAVPRGLGSGVPSGNRTQDSGQVGPSVLPLHQWNWEPRGVKGYINHTQNMPDMSSRPGLNSEPDLRKSWAGKIRDAFNRARASIKEHPLVSHYIEVDVEMR